MSRAARSSCSRNFGSAIAIMAAARSRKVLPRNSAMPQSVTMTSASQRGVVTGPERAATMRLVAPPLAVDGKALAPAQASPRRPMPSLSHSDAADARTEAIQLPGSAGLLIQIGTEKPAPKLAPTSNLAIAGKLGTSCHRQLLWQSRLQLHGVQNPRHCNRAPCAVRSSSRRRSACVGPPTARRITSNRPAAMNCLI